MYSIQSTRCMFTVKACKGFQEHFLIWVHPLITILKGNPRAGLTTWVGSFC